MLARAVLLLSATAMLLLRPYGRVIFDTSRAGLWSLWLYYGDQAGAGDHPNHSDLDQNLSQCAGTQHRIRVAQREELKVLAESLGDRCVALECGEVHGH